MAGSDITLVAGLEGGGSLSGTSGKKINNQLQNIIREINAKGNLKIRPEIDKKYVQKQLEELTKDAVAEADKIRIAYEQAFQSLVQIQKHGGDAGGGSGGRGPRNQFEETIKYNNALLKTENLLKQVHNAQRKWSAAKDGESKKRYDGLEQQASALVHLREVLKTTDSNLKIDLNSFEAIFSTIKSSFALVSEMIDDAGESTRAINKDTSGYIESLSKVDKAQKQVEENLKNWSIAGEAGSKAKIDYDALKALVDASGEFAKLKNDLANGIVMTDANGLQYIKYLTADDFKERLSSIVRNAERFSTAIKNAGENTHRLIPSSDSEEYVNNLIKINSEIKKAKDNQKKWSAATESGDQDIINAYNEIGGQIIALDALKSKLEAGTLTAAKFNDEYKKISTTLNASYNKVESSDFASSKSDDLKKFTSQLTELDNAIEKSEQNLKAWSAASSGMASGDYEGLQKQIRLLDELRDKLLSAGHALNNFDEQMADVNRSNALHGSNIKKQNKDYKTFGDNILGIFEEVGQYVDAMDIIFEGIQYGRQMVEAVTDIDTAMTELRKVTDETEATYASFMDKAVTRATELGASVADVVSASADFARLGHDLGDASTLADAALVYKNVGDGISDIDTASSSIISTMQAFGIEAKNAMSIVDSFNAIGNNFAISSAGVGDALLNSAASLAAAGNDIHEAVALIAAANTTIQDPGRVGRMFAQQHSNVLKEDSYIG